MESDYGTLARAARTAAEEKKGIDTVILDVRGVSGVTDYYVIVTGTSAPHLKALDAEISRALKGAGRPAHRATGGSDSGWIVRDFLGVVVHLMTAEMRQYYAIEDLWGDAPRVA
ncbi:MAG: ribosome silencing factor [Verrucomicrobia bacterium]|jgi:ribosome-associated protein|nr:ribosome silencing factor [Verrucomicrobiota bacterium]